MSAKVHIRLACDRVNENSLLSSHVPKLFTPGEVITEQGDFMRGHGTYTENDHIKASVAGVMEQVHKLISVKPLKNRYVGEIGDVVIGRISEVQQKRWKVDTRSRLDSNLLLSSVNLPGGELRRRCVEDEQLMRKYLQEGDLISAEVQNIFEDGSLSLYTRSLKYGKLSQGVLVKVFPSLVKRRKIHFHDLPIGASVILGNNGFIWITPTNTDEGENKTEEVQQSANQQVIPKTEREIIARLRNCILALANCNVMLYDTSIVVAYEESLKYKNVTDLLTQEVMYDIAFLTQYRLNLDE